MEINKTTLEQFTTDVCDSMLGLNINPVAADKAPEETCIVGSVDISGEWEAGVDVYVPEELGREIAANMFMMSDDELDDAEVLDAIGEVANMIGGNIKGCFNGECNLTIPVVERKSIAEDSSNPEFRIDAIFECNGKPFFVRMVAANKVAG